MARLGLGGAAWASALFIAAGAAFILFGLPGLRTILAIAALFVLPFLFLMRNAGIELEEKIFFSLFIGIGLFPLFAWLVNQVLPSFRLSVLAALALVGAAGFFLHRRRKKQQ